MDQGLKFLLGKAQRSVLGLDLAEHLVKGFGKLADFILFENFSADSIILSFGDGAGSLSQLENRY